MVLCGLLLLVMLRAQLLSVLRFCYPRPTPPSLPPSHSETLVPLRLLPAHPSARLRHQAQAQAETQVVVVVEGQKRAVLRVCPGPPRCVFLRLHRS